MEYKFVKQKTRTDCGIAVSTIIINFLQRTNISLEEIKYSNTIYDNELSFYNIEMLLKNYKIEFKTYYAKFDEFINLEIIDPFVMNVNTKDGYEHFIVVYKKKKTKYLIADPSRNDIKWIDQVELEQKYTGYFGVAKKFAKFKFKKNSLINLAAFLFDDIKLLTLFFVVSLSFNIVILLANGFLKTYSKNLMIDNNYNKNIIFIAYFLIFFIQIVLTYLLNRIIFVIKSNLNKKMCHVYFEKLLTINIEKFQTQKKEEWIKKISYISSVSNLLTQFFLIMPSQMIFFTMSFVMISFISPMFLILILIENVLIISSSFVFQNIMKNKIIENETESIYFSILFRELLDGNSEIKFKDMYGVYRNKIETSFNKNLNNENEVDNIKNLNSVSILFISKTIFLILFYISQNFIISSTISFDQLFFYISISPYISDFSSSLLSILLNKENYKISINEIKLIFQDDQKIIEKINITKILKIKCKNLNKYKNEVNVIKDINFDFDTNTFIYGKSGAGKTCLMQLLSGEIQDYEGKIFINDIDFKTINKELLKQKILYIGQDDYLFNGTIWANLQNFKNDIDLELFKQYNFFEILNSNNININKIINDNGANLSSGQKQIINFISSFFTNKELYLIDEPLSNVDRPTAYYLLEKFLELKKDSLILMTDHNDYYKKFFRKELKIINEK